jgi:hypothetical protein
MQLQRQIAHGNMPRKRGSRELFRNLPVKHDGLGLDLRVNLRDSWPFKNPIKQETEEMNRSTIA